MDALKDLDLTLGRQLKITNGGCLIVEITGNIGDIEEDGRYPLAKDAWYQDVQIKVISDTLNSNTHWDYVTFDKKSLPFSVNYVGATGLWLWFDCAYEDLRTCDSITRLN